MAKTNLNNPRLYINRELSWLEFNDRVLREGMRDDVPLLERLKFLAIVSSNLDEFFQIRVAGLMQARDAGVRRKGQAGMTPAGQLRKVLDRVRHMVHKQAQGIETVRAMLADRQVHLLDSANWSGEQERFCQEYFLRDVMPVLGPIAFEQLAPRPLLPGLRMHVAVLVGPGGTHPQSKGDEAPEPSVAVVPVPRNLPRFVSIPAESGLHLVRLEDIILRHVERMFPGCEIHDRGVFRITRDQDVTVDDDEGGDLLTNIEEALSERKRRRVVRLEMSTGVGKRLASFLAETFDVPKPNIVEVGGIMDATGLFGVASRSGLEDLQYEDWPPQTPADLLGSEDLFATLRERDVLLVHPYESFEPVVELVSRAADDPQVLAIKQTLYRTTGDSPIVAALARAAENGKQVTVLVELKARFDEARNVGWARALEDAGCDVIYGVAGLKTHAKMLLVIRREDFGIRRYLHLSTGNYNDKTARLYSDLGLMTTDSDLTTDAASFFNLLTGYSQIVGWSKLTIAPTDLRQRVIDMIDREAASHSRQQPGQILVKVNSLQDPQIIEALYRASQAGVRIRLNVRGICCLRPGVKGVSETIEVTSIVDRYLEHARIFYFRNGGHEEVYLSSADWMVRNLDKRLETFFPVSDATIRKRLVRMLETYFADNVKAHRLLSDEQYEPVSAGGKRVRAQQALHDEAVEAAQAHEQRRLRFQPLRNQRDA